MVTFTLGAGQFADLDAPLAKKVRATADQAVNLDVQLAVGLGFGSPVKSARLKPGVAQIITLPSSEKRLETMRLCVHNAGRVAANVSLDFDSATEEEAE